MSKYSLILKAAAVCLMLSVAGLTPAERSIPIMPMKVITEPNVKTDRLGGVDVPSAEVLKKMHGGQYILRAARGKLTEVPVQKVLLPHDDGINPQSTQVDLGPDGTVYVRQSHILCKSTDGGRTWTSAPINVSQGDPGWRWKVLHDGTFISVSCLMKKS